MSRETYRDRQRYETDQRDEYASRRWDERDRRHYDERGGGGSRRDSSRSDRTSNGKIPRWEADASISLRSLRKRSQSPDFERDRRREREAYDHRASNRDKDGERSRTSQNRDSQEKGITDPVFETSGLLAKESNNKNGIALKYAEPPEARKPKKKWRLYVFKDGKEVDVLHISRQSCYLLGRDRAVADIPIDHPSISKQHAVIQYRNIKERNEYGDEKQSIKPFLIDLDSANGSFVNDTEIPTSRYYEIRNGDTLKMGGSQREYILLAED